MRSRSLARVVMASLGVSVGITLGCSPSGPAPATPFSVLSISPNEGSSGGGTRVVIGGTGFLIRGKGGATVTVDGRPVNASPSLDGNTIDLTMPAHATGKVDVTVIGPLGQAQASVPGGYTYVHVPLPPPVITELSPNIGSTGGGTPMIVKGAGFQVGPTVTIGGIVTPFEYDWSLDVLYLSTPAHAAGTAEVIVTNPDGQSASAGYTYVSPATLDFNGDWQGWAENLAAWEFAHLFLTIRNNVVVSVSCGQRHDGVGAVSLTLDRPPVVANGGFSFASSGGDSITGTIVSPNSALGSINMASCISNGQWRVDRK
jgi:hypothetical protein